MSIGPACKISTKITFLIIDNFSLVILGHFLGVHTGIPNIARNASVTLSIISDALEERRTSRTGASENKTHFSGLENARRSAKKFRFTVEWRLFRTYLWRILRVGIALAGKKYAIMLHTQKNGAKQAFQTATESRESVKKNYATIFRYSHPKVGT